jgi:hypothetical protein
LWARGEDWTQRWGLWKKKKQQQKDSFAASRVRSKCRSLGVSEMEKVVVMSGEKDPEEKGGGCRTQQHVQPKSVMVLLPHSPRFFPTME